MDDRRALSPRKGRGAVTNAAGRYEAATREAFDDGWTDADPAPPPRATMLAPERARTIISRNASPDISFDQAINPYRGCEHGCIYCYARPNHAYAGLSPGLDFETRIFFKPEAPALLARELSAPGYKPSTIVLSGVTDCYQPGERTLGITRGLIEVLQRFRHPMGCVTKAALIQRDLDIWGEMGRAGLAKAAVSVTTLDPALARAMEPRAAAPHRRLETIRALREAGVPTTVMVAPVIPALNDHEIEAILEAAAAAGAQHAGYVVLRLPLEIKDLFREWLAAHAPGRAAHVMSLVRSMRGGKDYDAAWGQRQTGQGAYARLIGDRFKRACARLGLNGPRTPLDLTQFRVPARPGDQLALL